MRSPLQILVALAIPVGVIIWAFNRPEVSAQNDPNQPADVVAMEGADSAGGQASGVAANQKPHADMDGGSADPHAALAPAALYEIALRHANEGKHDAAIGHLDQAIQQDPENPIFFAARSTSYLALEDRTSALRDIEIAVKLSKAKPDFLTGMLVNRSQIYRQFQRDPEALADLDQALELNKNYVPALFNRSHIYLNQSETDLALADLDRAILLQPDYASLYFNRAMAYEAKEDMEKARADMGQFLGLTRSNDHQDLAHEILKSWKEAGK
ncbi:MAG: tetratricopeptide repeat protein [Planctomycetes bacterium]|nr:tetratricopeptide repeat protein [Planctomycetota bacterium]